MQLKIKIRRQFKRQFPDSFLIATRGYKFLKCLPGYDAEEWVKWYLWPAYAAIEKLTYFWLWSTWKMLCFVIWWTTGRTDWPFNGYTIAGAWKMVWYLQMPQHFSCVCNGSGFVSGGHVRDGWHVPARCIGIIEKRPPLPIWQRMTKTYKAWWHFSE